MLVRRAAGLLLLVAAGSAHDVISTNLTWTREVSRIVYRHCASCHREGGSAMPLIAYDQARPWAKAIRDAVVSRRMPPWDAVEGVGDFRDDLSLSEPEMEVLVGWVEGGAPEGDPVFLPHTPANAAETVRVPARRMDVRDAVTLSAPIVLAGIRPEGALEVAALLPDHTVERLLWVPQFRPQWNRTYYFREPLALPRGTRVLVYSASRAAARLLFE